MERCCKKVMIQLMVDNHLCSTDRSAEEEDLSTSAEIRASPLNPTLVIVVEIVPLVYDSSIIVQVSVLIITVVQIVYG